MVLPVVRCVTMDGNELFKRREALGMSRDELAKALQTTSVSIWRWENGERAVPPYLPLALETVERNNKSNGMSSTIKTAKNSTKKGIRVVKKGGKR